MTTSIRAGRDNDFLLDGIFGLFSRDVGIDLGTANTLVWVRGRGIVIAEPSVVAKDLRTGAPLAIGAEAKRMVGRTPASIIAIRPLKDGVISDFDMTELMLTHYIRKVHDRALLVPRPRVVVGIPSGVTEVEKRAVQEAAMSAGARWCRLVEEPMAAAIGAGLPVNEPSGSMIVDIGGGTTEVAVTSLGGSSCRARSAWVATKWTATSLPTRDASSICSWASAPPRTSRSRSDPRTRSMKRSRRSSAVAI